jgi:3-mercaptopyruvate sulfurtransferase SseA
MGHTSKLALLLGLVALLAACSPAPTAAPAADLPLSEADVPRVTADEAKAAVDSGQAVIVDVRAPSSYELEHVAGALSIPLADIEDDPAAVPLDKAQWIITYCT